MARICTKCGSEKKTDKGEICHNCAMEMGRSKKSESWCKLMSAMRTGYKFTEEAKEKMRRSHLGKSNGPMSEETKRKISESQIGKVLSKEHRRKLSESHKGQRPSEETLRKLSEVRMGHPTSEETRRKLSEKNKGHPVSEEQRAKLRKANLGKHHTEESKDKVRQKVIASLHRQAHRKTGIEKKVEEYLNEKGINSVYNAPFSGVGAVDFFLPDFNSVIECDGDYWHGRPGAREHDRERDEKLSKIGVRVLRMSEHEINKDWEVAKSRINLFLGGGK